MKVRRVETRRSQFQAEVGTAMQLEIEGFQNRMKSFLVGILPGQYLILRLPQLGIYVGQPKHLELESEVLVRYVHRGAVWGFKSIVKRVVSTPVGLFIIDFPDSIECYDLRREERIDCLLPGRIKLGKESGKGAIVDISCEGCRFVLEIKGGKPPKVEIDDELPFFCSFPGVEGEQSLTGRVKHIHEDSQRIALGLEFLKPDPKVASMIVDYISSVSPR